MHDKFANIPLDDQTDVLFSAKCKFGSGQVVYQKWIWSGIVGESIVFVANEVDNLTDDQLRQAITAVSLSASSGGVTISRNKQGFTFASFNFNFL
jgi:hypothetical protein